MPGGSIFCGFFWLGSSDKIRSCVGRSDAWHARAGHGHATALESVAIDPKNLGDESVSCIVSSREANGNHTADDSVGGQRVENGVDCQPQIHDGVVSEWQFAWYAESFALSPPQQMPRASPPDMQVTQCELKKLGTVSFWNFRALKRHTISVVPVFLFFGPHDSMISLSWNLVQVWGSPRAVKHYASRYVKGSETVRNRFLRFWSVRWLHIFGETL